VPFTFHWYKGVPPPFVGVAVNITELPWQNGLAEAEIETLTGKLGFTIMLIELEVAGLLDMQVVLEEVSVHVTMSLFVGL
jgi:hypothetical protein